MRRPDAIYRAARKRPAAPFVDWGCALPRGPSTDGDLSAASDPSFALARRRSKNARRAQGLLRACDYNRQTQKEVCEKCGTTFACRKLIAEASGCPASESTRATITMIKHVASVNSVTDDLGDGAPNGFGALTQLHAVECDGAANLLPSGSFFSDG